MSYIAPVNNIMPINNAILYTEKPRILFELVTEDYFSIIYIAIKNNNGIFVYTSSKNPELFSSINFSGRSKIVFTPEKLDLGNNTIIIYVYNNGEFSSQKEINIIYETPLLDLNQETEIISAEKYNKLLIMSNNTLEAYTKEKLKLEPVIANKTLILRKYFSKINDALFDLNNWINVNYPGLNRINEKQIIRKTISKNMYNNILNLITYP